MKNKFENKTKLLAMVLCAGMLATACDDNDDLISDLEDDVTILQGSVSDLLAAEADGLTVTNIETTTDGYIVTFSNDLKISIDNSATDDAITYVYDEEAGKFTFYADGEEISFGSSIVAITAVEIIDADNWMEFGKGRSAEIEIMVTPATAPVPSIDAFFIGIETEEDFSGEVELYKSGYDYEESAIFSVTSIEAISTGRYTLTISASADPSVYEYYDEAGTDEEDALYYQYGAGTYRLYVNTIDVANSDSQVYASKTLDMMVKDQDWMGNGLGFQEPITLYYSTLGSSESFFVNFGKVTTYDPSTTTVTADASDFEYSFINKAVITAGEYAAAGVDGEFSLLSDLVMTKPQYIQDLDIVVKRKLDGTTTTVSEGKIPVVLVNTDVLLGGENLDVPYTEPGSVDVTVSVIEDVQDFRLPYGSYEVEEGFAPEVTVKAPSTGSLSGSYVATSAFTAEFVDVLYEADSATGASPSYKSDYEKTALKLTAVAGSSSYPTNLELTFTLDINVGTEKDPEMVPFTFYIYVDAEMTEVGDFWDVTDKDGKSILSASVEETTGNVWGASEYVTSADQVIDLSDYIDLSAISKVYNKTAHNGTQTPVEGATFQFYYLDKDGEKVYVETLSVADYAEYKGEDDAFSGYSTLPTIMIEVTYGETVDALNGVDGASNRSADFKFNLSLIVDTVDVPTTQDDLQDAVNLLVNTATGSTVNYAIKAGSTYTIDISSEYVVSMLSDVLNGTAATKLSAAIDADGNSDVLSATIELSDDNTDDYSSLIDIDGLTFGAADAEGFTTETTVTFNLVLVDNWSVEKVVPFNVIFTGKNGVAVDKAPSLED